MSHSAVHPGGQSAASAPELPAAITELTSALGEAAVLTDPTSLGEFGDPYAPAEWTDLRPAAVVQPSSVEEVQAVVRIANEHRLTLWTVSRGKNNGYGGSAVRGPGSVLVHLGRMNKVVEVNEELAYAVVEPGVSFYDLYDELGRHGHRLWAAVPDLGWGSVLGNALDHGMGYAPNGDRAASVCGMEIVLADGTIVRTGMGAMEGSPSWHLSKRGFGPTLDGLFMQSNFGIVTKVGIWLMPKPQVYSSCRVFGSDDRDLEALVDTLRPLLLDGTITGQPGIYEGLPAAGWVSGAWTLRFGLYGREAEVDLKIATIRDAFALIDGVTVSEDRYQGQPPQEAWQTAKVHAGVPSQDQIDELGLDDPDLPLGHTVFSSVVPNTGAHARAITELFRRHVRQAGLGRARARDPRPVHHEPGPHRLPPRRSRGRRGGLRDLPHDGARGNGARVRRVPHARLDDGSGGRAVRVQRPRAAADDREDQGRAGSERHPVTGQVRNLAEPAACRMGGC